MPDAPAAAGVEVTTPGQWWNLPLEARTRHRAIAALVDARAAAEPGLAPRRNALVAGLRRTAAEAARQGGVLCRAADAREGEAAAAAVLVVSLVDALGGETTPAVLRERIAVEAGGSGVLRGLDVRVAGLPLAGAAVRLVARRLVEVTLLGRDVEVLLVQYVVAVPGRPELAVVSMTSPTVAAAPVLVPGFDAIAATFAFTAADGSRLPPPVTPAAPFARPGESGGGAARLQAGRRPRAPAPPSVAAMRPEQR